MLTGRPGTDEGFVERRGTADADDGRVRVLHLDDDDAFLDLSKRMLESKHDVEVVHETDPPAALDRLGEVDCVVSDYDMPRMNGIEFLETVRERHPDLPFILFTGKGSEEIAGEAISAGVTDYIQKGPDTDRFTVLANRITNAVERYRAQKRAEASAEQLRRIYERIDDAFVALDGEFRFTYVNQQATELLDSAPEELLGTPLREAFPGVVDTRFEEEYTHALETGETVTFEEYYEPLEAWFEVRAFPSESGLSVYFRDVTERKERERRYRAVFDNTYQFTGLMEPDGTLIEANETALKFVGADREAVVDRPAWETPWFQYDDRTREIAHESVEAARNGELYRDEFPIEGADGETIVIDYSVRPVYDDSGEVTLLVPEGRDITELKERQQQLREERAFTNSVFEAMPDIFYAFDESGEYLRWNDRFGEVTGYTDAEIADAEPLDLVPDSEADRVSAAIDRVFEGEGPVTVESELLTKDGERIPYEFAVGQLTDDDGETLGLVGVGRDISDRRRRERRFEAVFNNTFQFTGLLEPDGTLVEANDAALEFGGVDRDEVVGKRMWEAHWFQESEETRRTGREAVEAARNGEFFREELPVQGDDRTAIIDFSVKPVYDDSGEVTLLVPEGRDITELKERERALERSRDLLGHAEELANTGGWEYDVAADDLRWTDGTYRIHDLDPDGPFEPTPESALEFYRPEDRGEVEAALERCIKSGEPYDVTCRLYTDEGRERWVRTTGEPVREDGEVVVVRGVAQDITERKERERTLRRQNEQLETFASIVSHDLRNPLTVANGNLELAMQTGDDELLEEVDSALDRIEAIIDDVLRLAQHGEIVEDPNPVSVGSVLEAVETDVCDVETAYPDGVAVVAEEQRLYSLLCNLIDNAVEHGSTSSRTEADDAVEHGDDVRVEVGVDGDTLYVSDDGVGIPPEDREGVFEYGYSENGGTGFGLAIVEAVAEAHGWEVEVTESRWGGARFEISGLDVRPPG